MEAIRLTTQDDTKVFVALEEVNRFESVKKGIVHFDSGATLKVKETFTILDYLLENYVFEIEGTEKNLLAM